MELALPTHAFYNTEYERLLLRAVSEYNDRVLSHGRRRHMWVLLERVWGTGEKRAENAGGLIWRIFSGHSCPCSLTPPVLGSEWMTRFVFSETFFLEVLRLPFDPFPLLSFDNGAGRRWNKRSERV